MENGLPTSNTDFLCASCERWCDGSEATETTQRPSNSGASAMMDIGRAVSGQPMENRLRLVCRSCVEKRVLRSTVYTWMLVGIAVILAVAFGVYWLIT